MSGAACMDTNIPYYGQIYLILSADSSVIIGSPCTLNTGDGTISSLPVAGVVIDGHGDEVRGVD